MTQYKEFKVGSSNSPFGFLGPLLILTIFFTAFFFLAKGLFWLLSWVAPILLIITLIIDYKIVVNFLKYLWELLKNNTVLGIISVILVVLGYPFVCGFLLLKALGKRSIGKVMEQAEKERNTYTEYEEVVEDDSFLELPPLQKQAKQAPNPQKSNEYDDMFK